MDCRLGLRCSDCTTAVVGSRWGLYSNRASNSSNTKLCNWDTLRRPPFSPGLPTINSAKRPGVPTRMLGFRLRIVCKLRLKVVPPMANWAVYGVFSQTCRATLTI
eukprot:scaffold336_cov196-Amphora_coffeaeformis.AAC.21